MTPERIARWLALLVVVGVVAPFAVYAMPAVVGGDHSFVVLSGSMEPAMAPGDVVVVEETNPATIEERDVITFTRTEEDTPTTHRVVDIQREGGRLSFETKGDANEDPDAELVPAANVIGTVVLTIPLIGHVIQFANTTAGFVLVLLGPLGLLALTEVWSLLRSASDSAGDTTADAAGSTDERTAASDEVSAKTAGPFERAADSSEPSDRPGTAERDRELKPVGRDPATADVPMRGLAIDDRAPVEPSDGDAASISITARDLTMTTGLLVVLVPYTLIVAFRLRTALSVSVAFGSVFLLLAAGALRYVAARPDATPDAPAQHPEDPATTPAPDGGRVEGDP